MKLTLTQVKRFPSKIAGGSDRIGIKCHEYGDKWLSGFIKPDDPRLVWKVGDQVEWEVKQNGEYLNLVDPPKATNNGQLILNSLEKIFDKLEDIDKRLKKIEGKIENEVDEDTLSVDQIPL